MTELIERYVHQVGRYLPPKERAEIEAELRSQIQDQLDDRYAGSPTPDVHDPEPFAPGAPEELSLAHIGAVIFAGGFRPAYRDWLPWPDAFLPKFRWS